jgi:ligand-binding SRPBCC domain-containing protein
MRHTFEAEQWLPYPIELVFAFFANPENLPRLMPSWQKARIEQGSFAAPPPRPTGQPKFPGIVAGAGTCMTLSFRPFPFSPVRIPWDAEIAEFAWNDRFCDIQTRGPFAFWRHTHRVIAEQRDGVSGTLVTDHVVYEMHLGALGEFAHTLGGRRQIQGIFDFRHRRTAVLMPLFARAALRGGS